MCSEKLKDKTLIYKANLVCASIKKNIWYIYRSKQNSTAPTLQSLSLIFLSLSRIYIPYYYDSQLSQPLRPRDAAWPLIGRYRDNFEDII